MVLSAEPIPASPPEPIVPPVSLLPRSHPCSFQSSLHNFDFPVLKTWGTHRVLRCLNINRKGEIITSNRRSDATGSSPNFSKVRLSEPDLQPNDLHTHEEPSSYPLSDLTRPWNLRSKRVPIHEILRPSTSDPQPPTPEKSARARAVRLRSEGVERRESWPKIAIPLKRKEIDEDIYAMTGSRPRRRPKKRPRIMQRQLDLLLPGSWLPFISQDAYRVPDFA